MKSKIYINGKLLGFCENPLEFTQGMREKRRNGEISHEMNIAYHEENNEICIFSDTGRARRPLIIVENGKPRLRKKHLDQLNSGLLQWDDLIINGILEFLDAEEEENSYIAMTLNDLNDEHTHLEIDPATMLGICAGIIPFSNHNSSPRNTMESGMTKQALGLYVSNYTMRTDTRAHLLHHPQTPIVKTRIIDSTHYDLRPSGQNLIVALMSYEGYNMEDGLVINKSSLERGLGRSSFFRSYDASEKWYARWGLDKFEVPDRNIEGYRSEYAYRNLDNDGLINPESFVETGDVLLGKTSPPRFLEDDFGNVDDRRRETSVTVRHGENGIVDAVLLSETIEGLRLAKIRVRDTRQPEFGDKFASRHGQKGVIGLIVPPEDIPFTEEGIVPDLIINPHGMPSRMSVGQILEMVAGKAGCLECERIDATPFNKDLEDEIKQNLLNNGFESAGCESLYDGKTGKRFDAEILIGVTYYQKLHHMTTDKVYARSRGPVQVLTRQPTEGRAHEGGLRFGEMERDCLIAHGAALTLKERLLDESDKYVAHVCENCGMLAVYDRNKNKIYCPICGDSRTFPVEISYAFKLLLDELKSLCIYPKLVLGDKTAPKKSFKKKSNERYKPPKRNNIITGPRLADEEPLEIEPKTQIEENLDHCLFCGKKLNKNQKRICRSCARKQYASRIIKKLVSTVPPGQTFKKQDLKALDMKDIQIQDYIWTLQEFNLIDVDNNKFKLKDEDTLNNFRIESNMHPIDFKEINKEKLYKNCKTCGKSLHISQFYKISDGYEDNCKKCKRLIITAKYLEDIINYFGFDNEFTDIDLKKHVPNQNQLTGMIWSLQDNDLLIEKKTNVYVLTEKSICLKFLDFYNSKSIFNEKNSNENNDANSDKTRLKSKNNSLKSKSSNSKSKSKDSKSKSKNSNSKSKSNKFKGGFGKNNIISNSNFRKNNGLENIEQYTSLDSIERKKFEFILKLLRQGKSKAEVAKITEIKVSIMDSWYNQGRDKQSKNTIYFYNEINKIKKSKNKKKTPIIKSKKDNKSNKKRDSIVKKDKLIINKSKNIKKENIAENNKNKSTSDVKSSKNNNLNDEKQLMTKFLSFMRKGYSRIEASQKVGITIGQVVIWYSQGRNNHSENTIYFYNQLNLIEKNN